MQYHPSRYKRELKTLTRWNKYAVIPQVISLSLPGLESLLAGENVMNFNPQLCLIPYILYESSTWKTKINPPTHPNSSWPWFHMNWGEIAAQFKTCCDYHIADWLLSPSEWRNWVIVYSFLLSSAWVREGNIWASGLYFPRVTHLSCMGWIWMDVVFPVD